MAKKKLVTQGTIPNIEDGELQFTTSALRGDGKGGKGFVRVVWDDGNAWRLCRIGQGNDAWSLPGEEILFRKEEIQEATQGNRAVIIVSGPHSGLSSLYDWLTASPAFQDFRTLAVDLREADLRGGGEVAGTMRAIFHQLKNELDVLMRDLESPATETLEKLSEEKDPVDLICRLADISKMHNLDIGALVFRGFEALEEEVAQQVFGRLRALLESPRRPLGSLGIVFLGQSVRALDPMEKRPISTFYSLSDIYATTGLQPEEISRMCELAKVSENDEKELIKWSGREAVLVQAVLHRLQSATGRKKPRIGKIIKDLEKNRLPAFNLWVKILAQQLDHPSTNRIIEQLLRRGGYPDDYSEPRFALAELFIENWIRLDPKGEKWVWRSDCRRRLAAEAFTLKNFG